MKSDIFSLNGVFDMGKVDPVLEEWIIDLVMGLDERLPGYRTITCIVRPDGKMAHVDNFFEDKHKCPAILRELADKIEAKLKAENGHAE